MKKLHEIEHFPFLPQYGSYFSDSYSPHSVNFTFSTLPPQTKLDLAWTIAGEQQAYGRSDGPLSVCKTHSTSHVRTLYIENHGPIKLFTYIYIMTSTIKCMLPNQMYKQLVTLTTATGPCGLRIAQKADNSAGRGVLKPTVRSMPQQRVAVRTHGILLLPWLPNKQTNKALNFDRLHSYSITFNDKLIYASCSFKFPKISGIELTGERLNSQILFFT